MAVFRVERTRDYTVMSNHHLKNKDLSLKAKGLLSQMLSLPENWDYDSGSTLYIGYLTGYPESTVPLHTYDWSGSNRSSLHFIDVYGQETYTSVVGSCPSCGKQFLQGTYVAQSHASRGHAEYYECYLCHYTQYLGSYVYKNHGSGSYGSWSCPSCGSHSWIQNG